MQSKVKSQDTLSPEDTAFPVGALQSNPSIHNRISDCANQYMRGGWWTRTTQAPIAVWLDSLHWACWKIFMIEEKEKHLR